MRRAEVEFLPVTPCAKGAAVAACGPREWPREWQRQDLRGLSSPVPPLPPPRPQAPPKPVLPGGGAVQGRAQEELPSQVCCRRRRVESPGQGRDRSRLRGQRG